MVSTLCVCASLPTARSGGGDDAIGNNNNNKKLMLLFSHPNFCGLSLRMKKKKYKIGCVFVSSKRKRIRQRRNPLGNEK
jgi:hypothetical protein